MTSIAFDNSYARLPEGFFVRLNPTPVKEPSLIRFNADLAHELGLDEAFLTSDDGINILAGNKVADGSEPLAMAYAGHQFGNFVPQLGDGRANLLGEVIGADGMRRDIQLKGAGQTPFSRMGDGRAALGPVLREYVVSEAMHALGVPTTRALAAIATGQPVIRETILKGAILTRVAKSHLRVGTFQFFAARQDNDAVRELTTYAINRHYPEALERDNPTLAFLDRVIEQQAKLVAHWMSIGFIHGVMNTDNVSIAGETIDFGPCAFMDTYNPATVFSYVDQMGRYAYQNQPGIAQWNLVRLAQCLLPILDENEDTSLALAQASIDAFPGHFETAFANAFRAKLGLADAEEGDIELIQSFLKMMAENNLDFTNTFRAMSEPESVREDVIDHTSFDDLLMQLQKRWDQEVRSHNDRIAAMNAVNPAIIPRNHLVEEAIAAAENEDDFSVFHALANALKTPFDDQPAASVYTSPPRDDQVVHQTFCGT